MKILFLGTGNLLHPWYDDVLEVAADRWPIPLFDRSRPVVRPVGFEELGSTSSLMNP